MKCASHAKQLVATGIGFSQDSFSKLVLQSVTVNNFLSPAKTAHYLTYQRFGKVGLLFLLNKKSLSAKSDYGLIISPESPRWLKAIATTKMFGTALVSLSLDLCQPERITAAQKNGLAIAVWTIFSRNSLEHEAEETQIQYLVEQKIDYLITDDPPKLKALLNRL